MIEGVIIREGVKSEYDRIGRDMAEDYCMAYIMTNIIGPIVVNKKNSFITYLSLKLYVLMGTIKALSYAVRNQTVSKRNTNLKERLKEI